MRAAGVRGHKQIIDPADLRLVHGMLASSPARVWCELAPLLSCEELVCVGDFLLWRRQPQASRAELEAAIARYAGRAGAAKLLEALPELTDRSDSPPESTLRFRFVWAGLPPLAVNPMIHGPSGEFLGMPDLAFLRYRMLVDYEGDHHRTDRRQWRRDLKRVPRFEDADWHSTRAGADDLDDSTELIDRLGRRLRSRGWDGDTRA